MLEKKIEGCYVLTEFKNKSYDGRVFKLLGTSLVFQIRSNNSLRFWAIGHGYAISEKELDLINKVFKVLKEEVEKEN